MKRTYQYGKGWGGYAILLTAGSRDAQANPTLASGDVQISKDGEAFVNITSLPTVTPVSGVQISVALSATETEAKSVMIRFNDQTSEAEWEEQTLLLTLEDVRDSRIEYTSPSATGLVNRSGLTSQNITRADYPKYGIVYSEAISGASLYDYDSSLLAGAVIYDEDTGKSSIIIGGYYFDNYENTTHRPFGIATESEFNITEGGTIYISTNWSGVIDQSIDETSSNDGWTFITTPFNFSGQFSENNLSIWINENAVIYQAKADISSLPTIDTIIASGNAANWNIPTIDTIIASGTAAGWSSSVSAQDIVDIVSAVWSNTIDGTADAELALKYILAYCAGDSSRVGNAYTYRDFDNTTDIMTLTGSNSSRTRS